jgi:hypothetical protein
MVILYIFSTCWHMKSMFYECQHATALELETNTSILDLKTETDMYQEISKRERYSADSEWSTLKLLVLGQDQ